MAAKRKGLGRGLDSLIPDRKDRALQEEKAPETVHSDEKDEKKEKETATSGMVTVKTNKIEPNRDQPRKEFDEDALLELADSIKRFGVLQPLIVQKKGDYYEIIAGERRWRAAKLAGIKELPVIIKEFTDRESVEISLIENIQRENLNPIEEALAYKRLLNEFGLRQEEIAEKVSKSRVAVTNAMRILRLGERVRQMIIDEKITTGHGRALLAIEDEEQQYMTAVRIFEENLSVRETEKLVKYLTKPHKEKQEKKKKNIFIYEELEEKMQNIIGTKVKVNPKANGKGKIEIEYYSEDEFERIFDLIMSIGNNQ